MLPPLYHRIIRHQQRLGLASKTLFYNIIFILIFIKILIQINRSMNFRTFFNNLRSRWGRKHDRIPKNTSRPLHFWSICLNLNILFIFFHSSLAISTILNSWFNKTTFKFSILLQISLLFYLLNNFLLNNWYLTL